jgi:transposase InsO family protein
MRYPQVVQTRGRFHEAIRTIGTRVAQRILHAARTLDATNGVLDADANPRQRTVVALLARRQFALARLFFGCKV